MYGKIPEMSIDKIVLLFSVKNKSFEEKSFFYIELHSAKGVFRGEWAGHCLPLEFKLWYFLT